MVDKRKQGRKYYRPSQAAPEGDQALRHYLNRELQNISAAMVGDMERNDEDDEVCGCLPLCDNVNLKADPDPDPGPCVFTPPDPDTPITAQLIWTDTEPYATGLNNGSPIKGVLGVNGKDLIWRGNGKRIFSSTDGGQTISTEYAFPPGGATDERLTNIQFDTYFEHPTLGTVPMWYIQIANDSQPVSRSKMAYTFTGGSSWTQGPEVWNSAYSFGSFLIEGQLKLMGRRPDDGNVTVVLYDNVDVSIDGVNYPSKIGTDQFPGNENISDNLGLNQNANSLLPLETTYFTTQITTSDALSVRSVSRDTLTYLTPGQDFTNWDGAASEWSASNGLDTVLISDSAPEIMQWNASLPSGAMPLSTIPNGITSGWYLIGKKSTNWLAAGANSLGTNNEWPLFHSVESQGGTFVEGPVLVLPSDVTSDGSFLPRTMNIYSGEDANWYGYYVGADGFLRVIKFQYGTQSGNCAESATFEVQAETLTQGDVLEWVAADEVWCNTPRLTDLEAVVDTLTQAGYGGIRQLLSVVIADISTGWIVLPADTEQVTAPLSVTQDTANNGIRFDTPGIWLLNIGFSLEHNESNQSRTFSVQIHNADKLAPGPTSIIGVGRNTNATHFSTATLFEAGEDVVGDLFEVRIGDATVDITSVTEHSYTLSAVQVESHGVATT